MKCIFLWPTMWKNEFLSPKESTANWWKFLYGLYKPQWVVKGKIHREPACNGIWIWAGWYGICVLSTDLLLFCEWTRL